MTNTTVIRPAERTCHFADGWTSGQLWPFWVAPLIGAAIGGVVIDGWVGHRQKWLKTEGSDPPPAVTAGTVVLVTQYLVMLCYQRY